MFSPLMLASFVILTIAAIVFFVGCVVHWVLEDSR